MAFSLLTPVGKLRPNVLPILASWVAGGPVAVETDTRCRKAATLVTDKRLLVLHPGHCRLLGLLVAAQMLALPIPLRRSGRKAKRPPPMPRVRAALAARIPALGTVPDDVWARAFGGLAGVDIRNDDVELEDADAWVELTRKPAARVSAEYPRGDVELVLTDADFVGVPDALSSLAASIRAGHRPLHTLPDFPDVPFVVAQVRVNTLRGNSTERVTLDHRADLAQMYARCIRQSAEGRMVDHPPDVPAFVGATLDNQRLAEARAALRAGREFPVFTDEGDPLTTFDETQHTAIVMYNLAATRDRSLGDAVASPDFLMTFVYAYELLRIDTEIHLCVGTTVDGPAGAHVHLLLDFLVKGMSEPWTAVGSRVKRVLQAGLLEHLAPASFEPLLLARMATLFRDQAAGRGEGWCLHPALLSSRTLAGTEHIRNAEERFAASMVRTLDQIEAKLGPVENGVIWLPRSVTRCIPTSTRLGQKAYRGPRKKPTRA